MFGCIFLPHPKLVLTALPIFFPPDEAKEMGACVERKQKSPSDIRESASS